MEEAMGAKTLFVMRKRKRMPWNSGNFISIPSFLQSLPSKIGKA